MKIYTRTGDEGKTGLYGGDRRAKDDPRVVAYGTVDEANSVLGLARSLLADPELDEVLAEVQNGLFDLGADLATPFGTKQREKITPMEADDVTWLEEAIDHFSNELEPLRSFVLPGGDSAAAALHHARTVARRAEREVITLASSEEIGAQARVYLNRLSDLLFVMARVANVRSGVSETRWTVRSRPRSRPEFGKGGKRS